jgi:hypothetical protein
VNRRRVHDADADRQNDSGDSGGGEQDFSSTTQVARQTIGHDGFDSFLQI